MTQLMSRDSALGLLNRVSSVYLLVHLVEGADEVTVPICLGEAEAIVRELDDRCMLYVQHDAEDQSLYLGRPVSTN